MRQILLFQGYDSKDIFFEITGRGEGKKIIMETSKMKTEIVNGTTIRSIFNPGEIAGIFDVRLVVCAFMNWSNPLSPDAKSTSNTRTEKKSTRKS